MDDISKLLKESLDIVGCQGCWLYGELGHTVIETPILDFKFRISVETEDLKVFIRVWTQVERAKNPHAW